MSSSVPPSLHAWSATVVVGGLGGGLGALGGLPLPAWVGWLIAWTAVALAPLLAAGLTHRRQCRHELELVDHHATMSAPAPRRGSRATCRPTSCQRFGDGRAGAPALIRGPSPVHRLPRSSWALAPDIRKLSGARDGRHRALVSLPLVRPGSGPPGSLGPM